MLDPSKLLTSLGNDSRRLLHGRGGYFEGLEHLAIDWFAPVLLVTFYAEKDSDSTLLASLAKAAQTYEAIGAIVVQRRHLPKGPKETIYGKLPLQPLAHESGLNYHLSLCQNQNHGFFLDMKPGRDWVRKNAAGKRVLNLFAYTCSLSVAAIAGDAQEVINLDMAGGALATGRKNHQFNFEQEKCRRASYLPHDLFKSWGRLVRGAPYDLVVIDPPSNQGKSFRAETHYPKILRRLPELLARDSQVLACLNAPHLDESFLTELFANFQNQGQLPRAQGFEDRNPAASLKALLFSAA